MEILGVEPQDEDGLRSLVGIDGDDREVSRLSLFVDDDGGEVVVEHDDESLMVRLSPFTGTLSLVHQAGPWSYAWSSDDGDALAPDLDQRWAGVVLAWRLEVMEDDQLDGPAADVLNVDDLSSPLDLPVDEWLPICAAVTSLMCEDRPPSVALAGRLAGAAYCMGVTR